MKKFLSLIMVFIMMVSFSGCTGNTNKGIELTLDNYTDYLNVDIHSGANNWLDFALCVKDNPVPTSSGYTFYLYNQLCSVLTVEGVSQNFNYEDVHIEVEITGKYDAYDLNKFDSKKDYKMNLVVDTNIAGEGRDDQQLSIEPFYTHDDFVDYEYKIVAISGRVVPANN